MREISFQDIEGNTVHVQPSSAAGLQCFWLTFKMKDGKHKSEPVPPTMDQLDPSVHLSETQLRMLRDACDDMLEAFAE